MQRMLLTTLFLFALFVACKDEPSFVMRSVENGVEIIKYEDPASWAPKFEVQLEEVLRLSGYGEQNATPFARLSGLMLDRKGKLFVVEQSMVHEFSETGEYEKSFGGQGVGPEESRALGTMFFYDGFYYLFSLFPLKLMKLDNELDLLDVLTLPRGSVRRIVRDVDNSPLFFTHFGRLQKEVSKNTTPGSVISYHTFDLPAFQQDTLAADVNPGVGERIEGVLYIDYQVPRHREIARDSTLWLNETVDYRIKLLKKNRAPRAIAIDMPLIKLTDAEQQETRERLQASYNRGMFARAGLKPTVRKVPEYHQQIQKIQAFGDEIWVALYRPENQSYQEIHTYHLNGDLTKQLVLKKAFMERGRSHYRYGDDLYTISIDDEGYVVKKYKMTFVQAN